MPPPEIRELRLLTRQRRTNVEERSRWAQRLDKVLQDAGIKLSSVASDILGISGRQMLAALVDGTHDPVAMADLAKGRLRSKIPQLQAALTGRFGPTHAVVVADILGHLDFADESIQRLQTGIDELIAPFVEVRDRLCSIPGVDTVAAESILAEIGVDMTRFATPAHLASWAGMCPGQYESAGKQRHGTARPGNRWLQRTLTVAAMAASKTNGTYLAAQYRRLVVRRGKAKSRKAVGHSILIGAWHIIADDVTWNDLGENYFEQRSNPTRQGRRKIADLRSLGWTTVHNTDGTITLIQPDVA